MIEALTDLLQSVLFVAWGLLTVLLIRRVNRLQAKVEFRENRVTYSELPPEWREPKAICGCGHHQCFHDDNGCGAINITHSMSTYVDQVPCGCKRYMGPEQLPTVIP